MVRNGKARQRNIIIKFNRESVRDRAYKARFNLKTRNKDGHRRIFVNEDLTATRGALAYRTRTLKKEGRIMDCWTVAGKIMVKKQKWTSSKYYYRCGIECLLTSMNCVNQVNRINIFVYNVVKYFSFRKLVTMKKLIEETYETYILIDKHSTFNLNSLNYSDCNPHNFGNDIAPNNNIYNNISKCKYYTDLQLNEEIGGVNELTFIHFNARSQKQIFTRLKTTF